jgi:signal transduction histidine kinase
MVFHRISRDFTLPFLGVALLVSLSVITLFYLETEDHIRSQHQLLMESLSQQSKMMLDLEVDKLDLFVERFRNEASASGGAEWAHQDSLKSRVQRLMKLKDLEYRPSTELVVVDRNAVVVSDDDSENCSRTIRSDALNQSIQANFLASGVEIGDDGFPHLRVAQSWSFGEQPYWIWVDTPIRQIIDPFKTVYPVEIGMIRKAPTEEGLPLVSFDFVPETDPSHGMLVGKLQTRLSEHKGPFRQRIQNHRYVCDEIELSDSDGKTIGSILILHDFTRWERGRIVGFLEVSLILLSGYVVFIFLFLKSIRTIKYTLLKTEDHLVIQGHERDQVFGRLKEKELMFRNLYEGTPIPMIQIDYDRKIEAKLIQDFKNMDEIGTIGNQIDFSLYPSILQKLSEGRIEHVNAAAIDMFSIDKKVKSRPTIRWFMESTDGLFKTALINLLMNRRCFLKFECEVFPLHGAKLQVIVDFAVINHGENLDSILVSFQDITEQKREHEAALVAKEEAEEANRLKSSFLANMSHELKTPLNAIIGFSDLLSESVADEGQKEQLKLIRNSGRQLLNIVRDILELTKIESERHNLTFSLLGLQEFVADFLHPFRSIANKRDLILTHVSANCPSISVFCDQSKLHHILSNLIGNSIKFTEKGLIEVEADFEVIGPGLSPRMEELNPFLQHEIKRVVKSEFDNPLDAALCQLSFVVSDSGIGVNPEKMQRIFEPFVQEDSSMTRKFGGAGLGLTVCRKLIDVMGGSLTCENLAQGGCRFKIVLCGVTSLSGNF